MSGGIKKTVLLLLVVAVVGISIAWYSSRSQASTLSYRAAEVKRGDLQATITATGTIEPVES
ncbi:MAG: RND transporter, partial [Anaerohalosphaeraceae bacterium]